MQILIDQLSVRVIRADGKELSFDLSDQGLTISTNSLTLEVDDTGRMTTTVPFEDAPDA